MFPTSLPRPTMVLLTTSLVALAGCERSVTRIQSQEPARATVSSAPEVAFVENATEPFGTFDGVAFARHTGMFEGETSLGEFRVPYEIVAPEDPGLANGTVLVEPPHWAFPQVGREFVIGRQTLFGHGIGYATVGFGTDGFNILDVSVTDAVIAGEPVSPSPIVAFAGISDEEILVQFAAALSSHPFASERLGHVDRRYLYGLSQTADVGVELLLRVAGTARHDLFDLSVLHGSSWTVEVEGIVRPGGPLQNLQGDFVPPSDVGRVLFVFTEGDLVVFDSEQYRRAVGMEHYRIYEVAGAAHAPTAANPLDHWAVARAVFVAGDAWIRAGSPPTASRLIESAPEGQIDPVYADHPRVDPETGIARDPDLNARGGVRLPDLEVGRARFVASDPATPTLAIPGLEPLSGSTVDLACEPEPGSDGEDPRFRSHGDYVHAFNRQVNGLESQGLLLEADAEAMRERAAESDIGMPGACGN